jgi:hypothetical protein
MCRCDVIVAGGAGVKTHNHDDCFAPSIATDPVASEPIGVSWAKPLRGGLFERDVADRPPWAAP